jgi:hypothetical protein
VESLDAMGIAQTSPSDTSRSYKLKPQASFFPAVVKLVKDAITPSLDPMLYLQLSAREHHGMAS